jgi:TolA-binding protein
MPDPTTYETIERYLLGQLPEAERAALDARMAAHPELAEQFARQKQEHLALGLLVEDDLRSRLDDWKNQAPRPARPGWFSGLLLFLIGAALLLVFFWWLSPKPEPAIEPLPETRQPVAENPPEPPASPAPATPGEIPETSEQAAQDYLALAAEFAEPVRFGEGDVREGTSTPDTLQTALQLLRQKRYRDGLSLLETFPAGHPNYADAQYFQGLAWYEQGHFNRAIPFLKKTAESEAYLYSEQAAWYLLMAYLQNKQAAPARRLARQIAADEGHPYQPRAKALLRRL